MVDKDSELSRIWAAREPTHDSRVHLVVVRPREGERETPDRVVCDPRLGIRGDRWSEESTDPDEQVTLMMVDVAKMICDERRLPWELAGDNLIVGLDLSEAKMPVGTRLRIGTAVLEVSPAPHLGCKQFTQRFGSDVVRWVNHKNNRPARLRGLKCRVLEAGEIAVGDRIELPGPG